VAGVDAAVVGGGVIGLSIAYELARRGASVAVLDAGPLGRAASWAGAGMLAPVPARPAADVWGGLRARSLALQAEWAEALRAETGLDNGYRRCGGLDVAAGPEECAELERRRPLWEAEGVRAERLDAAGSRALEPALTGSIDLAYHFPDRAQVRNPRHLRALVEACRLRGARLLPGRAATGFSASGGRVVAVETAEGPLPCGAAVTAAGPWTARLLAPLGVEAPTPPLRGQIALLHGPEGTLRRIVERGSRYLVPRDDGRVLVGSTEEWAGFESRPTAAGIGGLLEFAAGLCPALGEAEFEAAWAGLRPASRDRRPYLGRVPGHENLYVAAGHRRVGIQLAPGSAELIADLVTGRRPRWDEHAFGLDRPDEGVEDAFDS
jgi:glycine oxidase